MKIINNKQLVNHLITHLKKHSIEIKKVEFSPAIYEPEFRDGEYFLEKLIEPTKLIIEFQSAPIRKRK